MLTDMISRLMKPVMPSQKPAKADSSPGGAAASSESAPRVPKKKKAPSVPFELRFVKLPAPHSQCPICTRNAVCWATAYPSNDARFRGTVVLYCGECGSGHVPDADVILQDYYSLEYAATNRHDRDVDPREYFEGEQSPKRQRYFARASDQLEAIRRHAATFERILDYGSGPGYLLYESGVSEKFAVEYDRASDKYLEYIGATRLDDDDLPADFFDAIVCSHVVEHFTTETLERNVSAMLRALRPAGVLLIEVPHGGHTFVRIHARQDPHTLFFTPQGLRDLVTRLGGEILEEFARAKIEERAATNQVYFPDPRDSFASSRRGGLTLVVRRRAEATSAD